MLTPPITIINKSKLSNGGTMAKLDNDIAYTGDEILNVGLEKIEDAAHFERVLNEVGGGLTNSNAPAILARDNAVLRVRLSLPNAERELTAKTDDGAIDEDFDINQYLQGDEKIKSGQRDAFYNTHTAGAAYLAVAHGYGTMDMYFEAKPQVVDAMIEHGVINEAGAVTLKNAIAQHIPQHLATRAAGEAARG